MEYHLSITGERSGPFTQFQIIEKIRDGTLKGDELAWHRGMEEWRPLREITDFDGFWRPGPEQIAVAEHVRKIARTALDAPRPWLRFWARVIDYVWFSMLLSLLMSALLPANTIERMRDALSKTDPAHALLIMLLINTLTFVIYIPLEALWLARRGTTPGKALLRIQVRQLNGNLPTAAQALVRSALVFVRGMALCLPIIPFFTMSWSRLRLLQAGCTSWDEHTGLRVEHGEPETWRFLVVTIIVGFMALMFVSGIVSGMAGAGAPLPK